MTNLFNSLSLTQKRLLTLVKYGLWGNLSDKELFTELSSAEWEEIIELAAIQGVLGIAHDGIKGLPYKYHPPREILIRWTLGVKVIEDRYYDQVKELQLLTEIYRANNIKCLLLKGPGIGQLYPFPEHRESGDLDVYLFGDYEKGNHLMEERGIKVNYEGDIHSKFLLNDVPIENHFSFLQIKKNKVNQELEQILYRELSKSEPQFSGVLGAYIPPLSFNLLFLFNHALRHFLRSGIVLRQICDWALLLRESKGNDEFLIFYEIVRKFDLHNYVDVFNFIAVEYLGLSEIGQVNSNHDPLFAQKVITNILNLKKLYPVAIQNSHIEVFWRKVHGAVFLFRNRWKYKAINNKMFLLELQFRFRNVSQIFKN